MVVSNLTAITAPFICPMLGTSFIMQPIFIVKK